MVPVKTAISVNIFYAQLESILASINWASEQQRESTTIK